MNLLQLHYFKILAEKEHLLSSAKAIHISAPALSSSISKLEEELGVELFDHVGRGLRLNQNGRILYVHVCNIFSELDMVEHKFRSTASQSEQTVNVGSGYSHQLGICIQRIYQGLPGNFGQPHSASERRLPGPGDFEALRSDHYGYRRNFR